MKKAVIPVSFDAEKLSAAKLYMAQKDLSSVAGESKEKCIA